MRNLASRTTTPLGDDVQPVEPSLTRDQTVPELAPPVRPTPVGSPIPERVRSRKQTLVSPIPALLAASMTEIRDDRGEATPVPVLARAEDTSRFETAEQRALLMTEEYDYVVEVTDTDKGEQ